jgi:Zn-dependent protease
LQNFSDILTLAPGFIIGLTFHEFSHAYAAYRLGDDTAQRAGRLTLNPAAHLDLFGSLMLIVAGFGWAKPVPVDANNFRSPRRDMALVAMAGPVSNVIMATVFSLLLHFADMAGLPGMMSSASIATLVLVQGVWINVILAVFNLIPVPPLDGSRIVAGVVPPEWNHGYEQFERVGPMLLFGLILLASLSGVSILSRIMMPVAEPLFRFIMGAWLFH